MTATTKHSLISCYTKPLFGNALCIVTTSHTHSTYAHIYAQAHSFHVQLGSTVVKSIFCFKSRPAEVLLCRIKNTFVNTVEIAACQNTFTRIQEA